MLAVHHEQRRSLCKTLDMFNTSRVLFTCLFCLCSFKSFGQNTTDTQNISDSAKTNVSGTIKIVKLLWNSSPQSAATTLTKSLTVALDRGQVDELRTSLSPLDGLFQQAIAKPDDPRNAVSLAASALAKGDSQSVAEVRQAVVSGSVTSPELLTRVWFVLDQAGAFDYFAKALSQSTATSFPKTLVGITQIAIASDRQKACDLLLAHWANLPAEQQISTIEPLTAQPNTMMKLVQAVQEGRVSKDMVNTNQVRKWQSSDHTDLKAALAKIWGQIREGDNIERQKLVKEKLALLRNEKSQGSVERGQKVFQRVCSQCHQLHGAGTEVGPNIENNGRGNLEQLVSNVFDPSLVIGNAFQARIVITVDGEVVTGLVIADDERFLKLKIQGGKIVEFDKEKDIEAVKTSTKSLMPDGIEEQLTQQEILDLFALLCLVKAPNAPDNSLIPGAPASLVNP
jgi:putative heme-binding domain-containing protein